MLSKSGEPGAGDGVRDPFGDERSEMEHELVGVIRRGVLAASLLLLLVPLVALSVALLVRPARPSAVLVLSALLEAEEAALESLLPQQSEKSDRVDVSESC